jgi:hypothetical protein
MTSCIDIERLLSETTVIVSIRASRLSLLKYSHDTTGSSSTGVTSLERVGVSTLTEIILAGVYDNGSANDGLGTEEGNVLVCFVSIVRHTTRLNVLPVIWTEAFPDASVLTFPACQL